MRPAGGAPNVGRRHRGRNSRSSNNSYFIEPSYVGYPTDNGLSTFYGWRGWRRILADSCTSLRRRITVCRVSNTIGRLFQSNLAIILLDNSVTLAGALFEFRAAQNLHCTTGVLYNLLVLQNTSCQAYGGSIRP